MCSQQQSTRQVYGQLFASHNLSMHTCRHTLYASHICGCTPCHRCQVIVHVLSLHDRTHACVLAPLSSASPLVSVRNGRDRALSISFISLSFSVARQPPLLSTDFGVDISVLTLSRSSFTQLSRYARFSLVCIIFWFTFERLRIQSMLLVAFCSDRRATAAPCSLSTCAHSVSRSTSVPC